MRIHAEPPATPAAARILSAAADLFYAEGIGAVGVDRIADEAGTTKKTIYDRFGSKEGLVVAYLRARHAQYAAHVHDTLDAAPAGADPVLVAFDALAAWIGARHRGCGFVNAYAELGATTHAGVDVIRDEKAWVEALFASLAAAHHPEVADPDALARRLAVVYEGAIVRTSAADDRAAMGLARDTAALLIAAASGPAPGARERPGAGPAAGRPGGAPRHPVA
ncbi:TetR/AcrR family transcriptional regulator [Agilicoccus flavus]|uniref:TetR/AcrR family transcriptional regulator n=1 Tax=Agilicoccus flavus TaxID=2775968 RepID=UPI001CF6EC66|nr:TetR/AcrR family transcriptional regulator [Agilicoccus flavus]